MKLTVTQVFYTKQILTMRHGSPAPVDKHNSFKFYPTTLTPKVESMDNHLKNEYD